MQLHQITLEHVRLHRQLNLPLASGITVLEGANESGKSTLAEAIHRALFLPARSAGAALNQLRSRPFEADPTISLQFSADGTTYQLRKTFAGSRGSVSLSDAAGGVLEGERAEERLAELVGATAVRGGNLSRLRERWAHLWVWQGQAGVDPLSLAPATIDQERLLQQLQSQAQTIQSGFDQQLQQLIRQRWSLSHTDGGREGRAGSELDQAIKAEAKAAQTLQQLEQEEQAQQQAQQDFAEAASALQALDAQLPLLKQRQQLQDKQLRGQEQLRQWQPVLQRAEQAGQCLQQLQRASALRRRSSRRCNIAFHPLSSASRPPVRPSMPPSRRPKLCSSGFASCSCSNRRSNCRRSPIAALSSSREPSSYQRWSQRILSLCKSLSAPIKMPLWPWRA